MVDSSQLLSILNIPDGASISGTSTPPPNAADNGDTVTSGNESDNTQPHSSSNHSFDKVKAMLAPKTAQLLANWHAHGDKLLRLYYEPLDIIDTQVYFDSAGIRWNGMFQLGVNNVGSSNVVNYDDMQKRLRKWFRRLCSKYSATGIRTLCWHFAFREGY